MPDVVSNTTPFQYLHQISQLDLLPRIYRQVNVPQAVRDELLVGQAKGINVPSVDALTWVSVEGVSAVDLQRVPAGLDAGEREAIALALGKADPLLIVDDAAARRCVTTLGIPFTGTLGLLVKAKRLGLIPTVRACLDQLDLAGFYLKADVRERVLSLAGEAP